jgi:hypothetical protein
MAVFIIILILIPTAYSISSVLLFMPISPYSMKIYLIKYQYYLHGNGSNHGLLVGWARSVKVRVV